jgi:diaminohydroxyphosphoribosylaminopyrimidine deaminase/5-amino-6-(5-phosphoribosylamino)uracil reductase
LHRCNSSTSGIREVIVGATDPNPKHSGRGLDILRAARVKVRDGVLAAEAMRLNEPFNHWIVHGTPFVTVKAGMSLDGKIATRTGESKWITSPSARQRAMRLRQGADAILVGAEHHPSRRPQPYRSPARHLKTAQAFCPGCKGARAVLKQGGCR